MVLLGIGYFLNSYYCKFASEIKAYTAGEDFYFWGPRYCPATWGFDGINKEGLLKLDRQSDIIVVSSEESEELEELLTRNYLDFNVYLAGEGEGEFVIYETECEKCKN
ncbi:MAG: hypothetical protein PHW75_00275 [Patescibacteria group bacterium]|nr:hypothetical protein [Patescibacteria group bacterium]